MKGKTLGRIDKSNGSIFSKDTNYGIVIDIAITRKDIVDF